ncbi:ROK family glucokinase [Propionibacteriaceae bacterium Y1685]
MALSIGVDIGGTKVSAGVVDESGAILARHLTPTPSHSPRAVEDTIVAAVEQLRASHPEVASVGIGAAGWVDTDQATVRFSPHLAWREEPLQARLSRRIDLPLLIDNDANAATWAEYRFGAVADAQVLVGITLGTGIGGAFVIDGRLFRGTYGMAGEWGHMITVPDGHRCPCGNRGCWEQYASGNALGRDARELASARSPQAQGILELTGREPDQLTGADVTRAALAGDATAIEMIGEVGTWLGRGIANLAAGLDPDAFVIGGGLSNAGDLLLAPAQQAFQRTLTGRGFRTPARLTLARFRNEAGLLGAADLARHSLVEPPSERRAGFWPGRGRLRSRLRRRLGGERAAG